jgi:hypothetical protein
VIKDIHTGYIWLHPLTTRGATEVAKVIVSIIQQFGPMKILHTDNGKEFKNKLLCRITDFIKIQHRFGASYHPRAQGAVERENHNIERLLKKLCAGAVLTWPVHLNYVASCLNSRISSVKGTSAFALMFGREPNGYENYADDPTATFDQDAWEKHLDKLEKIVRPAINQKVNIAQLIREDHFNAKYKIVTFQPGDNVMAKDVTRTSKWHSKYEGPFEVVRRNNGGAYILKDKTNSILPFRFPPSHLKTVAPGQTLMEKSYPIRKILAHAPVPDRPYEYDYYVQFDIPDTSPVWLAAELFDSTIPIEKYWKSEKMKKAVNINASVMHDNIHDDLIDAHAKQAASQSASQADANVAPQAHPHMAPSPSKATTSQRAISLSKAALIRPSQASLTRLSWSLQDTSLPAAKHITQCRTASSFFSNW